MSVAGPQAVVVFGSSAPPADREEYERARAVGRTLAELGYVVVNGGYGGAMEASAAGAKEAGGSTVGVTCSIWRSAPNRFMDRCVQTHSLPERVAALTDAGTAGYVVLPGATGTLAELAKVWEMAGLGTLQGRPIVCVGAFWRPLVEMMAQARPGCEKYVTALDGPEELARCLPATVQ